MEAFELWKPGLFVTATDTEVGKTVVSCAIARILADSGKRVGVRKPYASGCFKKDGVSVSEDTIALSRAVRGRTPEHEVAAITMEPPMAPGPIFETFRVEGHEETCEACVYESLVAAEEKNEFVVVEGIGGILVPLHREVTVLDMAKAIGYPVVVVARAGLGTLNHTALTCMALRNAGLRIAGIVVNRCEPDDEHDASLGSNPRWMQIQNDVPILAMVPNVPDYDPMTQDVPEPIIAAMKDIDWFKLGLSGG